MLRNEENKPWNENLHQERKKARTPSAKTPPSSAVKHESMEIDSEPRSLAKTASQPRTPSKRPGADGQPRTPGAASDSPSSQLTASPQVSSSGESVLWVDKYKPKALKSIIGEKKSHCPVTSHSSIFIGNCRSRKIWSHVLTKIRAILCFVLFSTHLKLMNTSLSRHF